MEAAAARESENTHKLVLSLEDLYNGCERKFRVTRKVFDTLGNMKVIDEILKIDVKPGWKKDTIITFHGKGNQVRGSPPADLVFVVDEKPHPIFKREGNDLITTHKISLVEALTGTTVKVTTLDGRELVAFVTDHTVKPDSEIVFEEEGMPSASRPGKKGNLRIKFDIIFPSELTTLQKCELKMFLSEVDG